MNFLSVPQEINVAKFNLVANYILTREPLAMLAIKYIAIDARCMEQQQH